MGVLPSAIIQTPIPIESRLYANLKWYQRPLCHKAHAKGPTIEGWTLYGPGVKGRNDRPDRVSALFWCCSVANGTKTGQ